MARRPPIVTPAMTLVLPNVPAAPPIAVGSGAWFAWLAQAASFTVLAPAGRFTATKEIRSSTRAYWTAARYAQGRRYRVYLGPASALTPERLMATARQLACLIHDAGTSLPRAAGVPAPPTVPAGAVPPAFGDRLLLSAKLRLPPADPDAVLRSRLVARLETALRHHHRLVVLAAPAGSGKTTLVRTWLARHPAHATAIAWLSLDAEDDDVGAFLAALLTALDGAIPALGTAAWDLFRASAADPPLRAVVHAIQTALLAHGHPLVIVLDDYHCLRQAAIHELVRLLVTHLPASTTLVITSRTDPPIGLARVRLQGGLTELRGDDLRFTPMESRAFFARFPALALDAADVTQLVQRANGWAAGLRLATLALHHAGVTDRTAVLAAFNGNHRYVFDYLVDEVFRQQPAPIRAFLLHTAPLAQFCGPLCAAVMQQPDAAVWLAAVAAAQLFLVPLDSQREWFRYHPLFREALLAWHARTAGAPDQAVLHQRASAWYAQAGMLGDAISHALNAQDWSAAVTLMAPLLHGPAMYAYFVEWPRWVAAIPPPVLQAQPALSARLAWVLLFTGYLDGAEALLDTAAAGAAAAAQPEVAGMVLVWRAMGWYWRRAAHPTLMVATQALALLPPQATILRAIARHLVGLGQLELGNPAAAVAPLQQALHTLQAVPDTDPFFPMSAALGLGRVVAAQGQLARAAALYRHVIDHCPAYLQGPAPYIEAAVVAYEWNDLATAERLLQEGLAVGERSGRGRYWPNGLALRARLSWLQGHRDAAHHAMEQAHADAALLGTPRAQADLAAQHAGMLLIDGDLTAAGALLAPWVDTTAAPARSHACTLMAIRLQLAAAGNGLLAAIRGEVVAQLASLVTAAIREQRVLDQISLLVLTALAHTDHDDVAASAVRTSSEI